MDFSFSFIFIIECIGVVSFSVSGTIIAIKKKLDFIGAIIFAAITSFGGGLLRDITAGVTPPMLLTSFEYKILAIICIATSVILFQLSFFGKIAATLIDHVHNLWIELTDSVGLAAFCVLGVDSILASRPESSENALLLVFCGCITGVGGGVIRDMMSAEIPLLFRKHIYLIPAVVGTVTYVLLLPLQKQILSYCISMGIILLIRVLAIKFQWNCPTPLGRKEQSK